MLTAALAFVGRIFALIPWWVWPVAALAGFGYYEKQRADGLQETIDTYQAEKRAKTATVVEVDKVLIWNSFRAKERADEENALRIQRLTDLNRLLKSRPPRRADAGTAPACAGSSGADLSAEDGEFLVGEASRADEQRIGLSAAYERIDALEQQLRICRGR